MCVHEVNEDEETEDCLNTNDRGVLWHTNDKALEDLALEHFKIFAAHRLTEGSKLRITHDYAGDQ